MVKGGESGDVTWSIDEPPLLGVSIDGNLLKSTTAVMLPVTVTVKATSVDDGATAGTKVEAEVKITFNN